MGRDSVSNPDVWRKTPQVLDGMKLTNIMVSLRDAKAETAMLRKICGTHITKHKIKKVANPTRPGMPYYAIYDDYDGK